MDSLDKMELEGRVRELERRNVSIEKKSDDKGNIINIVTMDGKIGKFATKDLIRFSDKVKVWYFENFSVMLSIQQDRWSIILNRWLNMTKCKKEGCSTYIRNENIKEDGLCNLCRENEKIEVKEE